MPHFELHQTEEGKYYFILKAANGETLVKSETYASKQSCQTGIESVQTTPTDTEVRDLT